MQFRVPRLSAKSGLIVRTPRANRRFMGARVLVFGWCRSIRFARGVSTSRPDVVHRRNGCHFECCACQQQYGLILRTPRVNRQVMGARWPSIAKPCEACVNSGSGCGWQGKAGYSRMCGWRGGPGYRRCGWRGRAGILYKVWVAGRGGVQWKSVGGKARQATAECVGGGAGRCAEGVGGGAGQGTVHTVGSSNPRSVASAASLRSC